MRLPRVQRDPAALSGFAVDARRGRGFYESFRLPGNAGEAAYRGALRLRVGPGAEVFVHNWSSHAGVPHDAHPAGHR